MSKLGGGDLAGQLANIFKKGLEADPTSARSLASSLSSHMATQSDGPYTKVEANYHTAYDSKRECGTCDNFDGQNGCQIVSGNVSADGTCDYWSGDGGDSATTGSGASDSSAGSSGSSGPADSAEPAYG